VWYILFFYWILELIRQCGIFCFSIGFWNSSDSVVYFVFLLDFGTLPTVVYFVFLLDFRTLPTVWYILFFYWSLEIFRQCSIFCFSIRFWNRSDSVVYFVFLLGFRTLPTVVYFVFLLDLRTHPTVWYILFFYWILELIKQCGIFSFSIRF
jgi:hypothetical protein